MKLPSFNPYLTKDNPVGLARYLHILFTNLWQVLVCNVLFLASCIPVITIGPGMAALYRVSCSMLRGIPVHPFSDYWEAFKQNLKQGLILSVTLVPLLLWLLAMVLAALFQYADSGQGLPMLLVWVTVYYIVVTVSMCLMVLVSHMKGSLPTLLMNAIRLCLVGSGYTVGGGISLAIFLALGPLLLPHSLPAFVLFFFSFLAYHGSFFGWKIADQYIFQPYYEQHPEEM